MNWRKTISDTNFNYINSDGKIIANVHIVGIKGRWRWTTFNIKDKNERSGWWGTKFSKEEAQKTVMDYLESKMGNK